MRTPWPREELIQRGYTSIPQVMPVELAAWPNRSDLRRTLLLAWHNAFSFPEPSSWWTRAIPAAVRNADPAARYESTRTRSHYIA